MPLPTSVIGAIGRTLREIVDVTREGGVLRPVMTLTTNSDVLNVLSKAVDDDITAGLIRSGVMPADITDQALEFVTQPLPNLARKPVPVRNLMLLLDTTEAALDGKIAQVISGALKEFEPRLNQIVAQKVELDAKLDAVRKTVKETLDPHIRSKADNMLDQFYELTNILEESNKALHEDLSYVAESLYDLHIAKLNLVARRRLLASIEKSTALGKWSVSRVVGRGRDNPVAIFRRVNSARLPAAAIESHMAFSQALVDDAPQEVVEAAAAKAWTLRKHLPSTPEALYTDITSAIAAGKISQESWFVREMAEELAANNAVNKLLAWNPINDMFRKSVVVRNDLLSQLDQSKQEALRELELTHGLTVDEDAWESLAAMSELIRLQEPVSGIEQPTKVTAKTLSPAIRYALPTASPDEMVDMAIAHATDIEGRATARVRRSIDEILASKNVPPIEWEEVDDISRALRQAEKKKYKKGIGQYRQQLDTVKENIVAKLRQAMVEVPGTTHGEWSSYRFANIYTKLHSEDIQTKGLLNYLTVVGTEQGDRLTASLERVSAAKRRLLERAREDRLVIQSIAEKIDEINHEYTELNDVLKDAESKAESLVAGLKAGGVNKAMELAASRVEQSKAKLAELLQSLEDAKDDLAAVKAASVDAEDVGKIRAAEKRVSNLESLIERQREEVSELERSLAAAKAGDRRSLGELSREVISGAKHEVELIRNRIKVLEMNKAEQEDLIRAIVKRNRPVVGKDIKRWLEADDKELAVIVRSSKPYNKLLQREAELAAARERFETIRTVALNSVLETVDPELVNKLTPENLKIVRKKSFASVAKLVRAVERGILSKAEVEYVVNNVPKYSVLTWDTALSISKNKGGIIDTLLSYAKENGFKVEFVPIAYTGEDVEKLVRMNVDDGTVIDVTPELSKLLSSIKGEAESLVKRGKHNVAILTPEAAKIIKRLQKRVRTVAIIKPARRIGGVAGANVQPFIAPDVSSAFAYIERRVASRRVRVGARNKGARDLTTQIAVSVMEKLGVQPNTREFAKAVGTLVKQINADAKIASKILRMEILTSSFGASREAVADIMRGAENAESAFGVKSVAQNMLAKVRPERAAIIESLVDAQKHLTYKNVTELRDMVDVFSDRIARKLRNMINNNSFVACKG